MNKQIDKCLSTVKSRDVKVRTNGELRSYFHELCSVLPYFLVFKTFEESVNHPNEVFK